MKLTGNTILITGGSSGIGLALSKTFCELGNKVIIAARNVEKMNQVKAQFPELDIVECDLTKQTSIDELVVQIEQQYPSLNILINNAAIQYNYDFLTERNIVNKIDYEVSANLTSTIKLCGLLLPVLLKNENSAIVNVSSGLAISPKKSAPVYCATKAGIHLFTKALRYQMEGTKMKIFEIMPPLVETPMTAGRGKNKMSTEDLVREFMNDFKNDKTESLIGKTKLLRLISRIAPKFADSLLKNG